MKFRQASISDIEHLVKIITQSEATGHELYSYKSLFELEDQELHEKLSKAINNEFNGQGLCYKDFYLAEKDGEICGGASFYLEGENGDSNHLMTGALMSAFTREEIKAAFSKLAEFRPIDIPKKKGTYQLDSVAIFENHRGKGLFGKLFSYLQNEINTSNLTVEVQVWKNNLNAIKAYRGMGFVITEEIDWKENGRILMTLN